MLVVALVVVDQALQPPVVLVDMVVVDLEVVDLTETHQVMEPMDCQILVQVEAVMVLLIVGQEALDRVDLVSSSSHTQPDKYLKT